MLTNKYYLDEGYNILLSKLKDNFSSPKDLNSQDLKENLFSFKYTGEYVRREFSRGSLLIFEVTEKCNLSCSYCTYNNYYNHHSQRNSEFLSFNKARNLIDFFLINRKSISDNPYLPLTLGFYGGEPLLNIDLINKIIDYSKRLFKTLTFSMTTNAMLLDKHMDFLVENEFALLISLDGDKQNSNYRLLPNGDPSFPYVYKNIKSLAHRHPQYFDRKVRFNCVLHNKNNIDSAISFFTNEFSKEPQFSELSSDHLIESKRLEFNKMFKKLKSDSNSKQNRDTDIINDIQKSPNNKKSNLESKALNLFINTFSDNTFDNYFDLLFNVSKSFIPTGTCFPFNRKIYLTAKGKILPCERIGDLYDFGNVSETEVIIDFEKIAEIYNYLYKKVKVECSVCNRFYFCRECIFTVENLTSKPACRYMAPSSELLDKIIHNNMKLLEIEPQLYKNYIDNFILL